MPSEKMRYIKSRTAKPPVGVYPDEKAALYSRLNELPSRELVTLLAAAFETLNPRQRREVFGAHLDVLRSEIHGGDVLLKEIELFRAKSLRGDYFEDGGNFNVVPDETTEWFDRLGDLLTAAMKLVEKNDSFVAVEAFAALFELIELMESCEHDIVFADEFGSWMIPVHMNEVASAYVRALAATEDDSRFAKAIVELLDRDQRDGFTLKVYPAAKQFGSAAQLTVLGTLIVEKKVKTEF